MKRKTVDPRRCSLLELAIARTGSIRRGAKVVAFVIAWQQVQRELGRNPTVDEYADWWKAPRSSAYDERAAFREVFPELHDPAPVLELLERERAQPSDPIGWTAIPA